MNIYLLTQDKVTGGDTFDSAVVAAESEEEARMIHPGWWSTGTWQGERVEHFGTWCAAEEVKVELLAKHLYRQAGVICASFNAG